MQYIGYLFFRLIVFKFSLVPFSFLYKIADFLAWLLYKVIGYRKEVVFKQLRQSFPNRTEAEIEQIAKASYRNLADIIVESVKGFSMSEADFRKRYVFTNPSVSDAAIVQGKSTIHIAAHYGNWEWGAISYPLFVQKPVVGFYKPLSNVHIEKYGRKKRGQFDIDLVPIGQTAQAFVNYKDLPTTYVFVSDQSTWSDNAHWVTFLGQDTACPQGGDKYARQLDATVFYVDIQRIKRGFYTVNLELLAENAASLPEEEVTRRFMARLERLLYQKPDNWLWSHKRWKKKRNNLKSN
ncbi:MAG: lysophospholipid acyltransferase family protein [Saprospiraceae bacterium]|nr:lysophospholipid acyltransferase family protein [Saprospiraceae bacterium]